MSDLNDQFSLNLGSLSNSSRRLSFSNHATVVWFQGRNICKPNFLACVSNIDIVITNLPAAIRGEKRLKIIQVECRRLQSEKAVRIDRAERILGLGLGLVGWP